MNPKAYYTVRRYCLNCGEVYIETFERGQVARRGPCTNCGVTSEQYRQDGLRRMTWPDPKEGE